MELRLEPGERELVREAASREKRVRHWRRLKAVELLASGQRPEAVAEVLSCARSSVYAWAKAWRVEGIEGLREAPRPGKRRSLDGEAERLLEALLEEGAPQVRGHRATGWTVPLLWAELEEAGYWASAP